MSEITTPAPPRVERLSPLPLAIAAVVLGGTLITAAVIVSRRTASPPAAPSAAPPSAVEAEPGFLARPPEPQGTFPVSNEAEILAALDAQRNAGNERLPEPAPSFDDGSFAPPPSGPSLPPPNPREEAYARALRSPLEVRLPTASTASAPAASHGLLDEIGVPHEPGAFQPPSLRDIVASSLAIPAASLPGAPPEAPKATPSPANPASLVVRFEPASRVPRLRAGTLIPALLLTAIHSDLPGDVLAQVERNIYDESQRGVLIPRGSRLLGRYENQLALGQNRLLIAWTQLQLPDGRSLAFPGLPAVARSGEAGLAGEVNNHTGRIFGTALLLSLISAGIQLSQPQESAAFGQGASARQVGAAAVGQELGSLATETLRRNLRIAPTIRLERGTPFHVFLNADLVFEGPR